jgi:hypothetical protein
MHWLDGLQNVAPTSTLGVLISRSQPCKGRGVKASKRASCRRLAIPRVESFLPHPSTERRARAYHLFIRFKRVDVLLSIADVREPVDVRYQG